MKKIMLLLFVTITIICACAPSQSETVPIIMPEHALSLDDAIALYEGESHVDDIKKLLARGINATNDSAYTSLSYASEYGYIEIVKSLIVNGADLNIMTKHNGSETALMMAVREGHTEIVHLLIDAGADIDDVFTDLSFAAFQGDIEKIKALIDAGANVNRKDKGGETPLVRATREGHTGAAKMLIFAGANIDGTDDFAFLKSAQYWGMAIGVAFIFPFFSKFRGSLLSSLLRGEFFQKLKGSHRETVLGLIGLSIIILANLLFG